MVTGCPPSPITAISPLLRVRAEGFWNTSATPLALGGSGVTGEELLYLNSSQVNQNGANTSWGNVTYVGNILIGTNGVLEFGAQTNTVAASVSGTVEVASGGNINVDTGITSFNAPGFGALQLDSGSKLTFGTTNSGSLAATGTSFRASVNGAFLAQSGSVITATGTIGASSTNSIQITFNGPSATFNSGVTGSFVTNVNVSSGETILYAGAGNTFTLKSDINLPQFKITPTSTSTSPVTVNIGDVTPGVTPTFNGMVVQAPTGAGTPSAPTGTLQLNLTSNIVSGQIQTAAAGATNTLILNANGFTLDGTGHAQVLGTATGGGTTTWLLQGTTGGVLKSTTWSLSANGGVSVSGPVTIWSTATSGTTSLSSAIPGATIDPTSIFEYASTTVSGTQQLVTNRTIGRLLVGNGSVASTLQPGNGLSGNINVGGDITVAASSTLDLFSSNVTEVATAGAANGGLNGAGTVLNNALGSTGTLTVDTTHGNGTFTGVIKDNSGSGGTVFVTKTGTGTQTLTGVNLYTGDTDINGGTLNVLGSLGAGSSVFVGNGTAVATLSGTGTINGVLTTAPGGGFAAHVAPGNAPGAVGTLKVGNLGFTIGDGTIFDYDLASTVTVGGTTNDLVTIASGGTLTFSGTTTFNFNPLTTLSTSGTYTLISGATGGVSGFLLSNTYATGIGSNIATFTMTGTGTLEVSFAPGVVIPASAYFNGIGSSMTTAGNFDSTISGTVVNTSAPGSVTNVFFSANRNVNSSAIVDAPLTVNSLNFGTGTGTSNGITISGTSVLTITGSAVNGNTAGNGITLATAGSDVISAPVALGASQTWTIATGGTLTVSGTVSGSGNALTKAGAGTLILSGSSTYNGGTTISAGTLQIGAGGSTGTIGGGAISNSGTLAFDLSSNYNLTNAISGNGTITDIGTGILTLSGSNTSTGGTTISTGVLSVGSTGSLGSGLISLANGTTLQYTGSSSGTFNQNVTITGTTGSTGVIANTGGQLLTLSGTLIKNGTTLDFGPGKFAVAGTITGSSPNSDVVLGTPTGSATVGLTSANTYNGPTKIYNGSTLLTGVNGALPTTTLSDVTLGSGTDGGVTNTLDLLGTSQTVASLTSSGTSTTVNQVISSNGNAGSATVGGSASGTTGNLTVNVASGTNTYSGLLGDATGSRNNFSLTKSGTGTLALTKANGNSYSGGTSVLAGTLQVTNTSGSATGSGAFNLGSLGILTGTGTIAGLANTVSGAVSIGNGGGDTTSILTMTASGSTTFSNAQLTFNLDTASVSGGSGTGNELALGLTPSVLFGTTGTTLTLNLLGGTIVPDTTQFLLFTTTSSSNVFGDIQTDGLGHITNFGSLIINNPGQPAGYYSRSYLALVGNGNGGFDIAVEVVPEPGTWVLVLGGLVLLAVCQRRRRASQG